ncbi:MAG: hypothetical protein ACI4I1_10300, partial [Oscillospiraceae bacterium]
MKTLSDEVKTNGVQLYKARKRMLEKQLDEMKNRISGRSSSFYPYITDRSGRISERKLTQFINELLDGPQKYGREYTLFDLKRSSELRELCECFLYCA